MFGRVLKKLIGRQFKSTKFAIVTLPRSGSYHLVSLLDSAVDITCFGEIYKRQQIELPPEMLDQLGLQSDDVEKRDGMGRVFLEKIATGSPNQITGFKTFPMQLREAGQLDILTDPSWKKIYLTRDGLAVFISRVRARETGVFVYRGGKHVSDTTLSKPVYIDIKKLSAFLDWQRAMYSSWHRKQKEEDGFSNCFFIDYSTLGDTPQMQSLLRFLGSHASSDSLTSKYVKQFRTPLLNGVLNQDELVAFLEKRRDTDLVG